MSAKESRKKLAIGDFVTVQGLSGTYELVGDENRKGEVEVSRGAIKLWVPSASVSPAPGTSSRKSEKPRRQTDPARGRSASSHTSLSQRLLRLDLHGLLAEQARARLNDALNEALIAQADGIEVVHGVGKGRLAEVVKQFGKSSRHIRAVKSHERNAGITFLYF